MSPLSAAEMSRAESELADHFDGLLALGERDDECPDYELLEAAVDGRLGALEGELFASRLAGDAALEREFADLTAMRDRLSRSTKTAGPVRTARGRRWIGLAAAAVLLAVLGIELRHDVGSGETQVAGNSSRPAQPLFADSFEGGTTDRWSN